MWKSAKKVIWEVIPRVLFAVLSDADWRRKTEK